MLTLKIGTRSFGVSESQVTREADRMFKLSAGRRTHRFERAKSRLARAGGTKDIESAEPTGTVKQAVATILSQGASRKSERGLTACGTPRAARRQAPRPDSGR